MMALMHIVWLCPRFTSCFWNIYMFYLCILFVVFGHCSCIFFVRFILVCELYIWYLWRVYVAFVLFLCCICEVCMFLAIANDAHCPALHPALCPRFTIFFLQWEQCIDLCCMRFNIFLLNLLLGLTLIVLV